MDKIPKLDPPLRKKEPYFIIRGRDAASLRTLHFLLVQYMELNCMEEARHLARVIDVFHDWHEREVPDLPLK